MKISELDLAAINMRPSKSGVDGVEALREFDSYFLAQILKGAQASSEEHLLDGGSAGRMYRDQFYQEVARVMAKQGGFGITEQLRDAFPKAPSRDSDAKPEEAK